MLLEVAHPNKNYVYFASISDLVIEAKYENGNIVYFETHSKKPSWIKELSEALVIEMFALDRSIQDRPFLKKENENFSIILFRKNLLYKRRFENYIQTKLNNKPKFFRKSWIKINS